MANFTAIGAKKLWTFRKDQLQAAKNKGGIIGATNQNPYQQQPPNHALQLNNDIHNRDVMNIRQDLLIYLIAICMVLGTYLTSFFVDKNSKNDIAITWFFNFNSVFLARALFVPVVFFVMNKYARRHVKATFWNEWAPDFIQNYNPNKVVEIKVANYPSAPIPPAPKYTISTSNTVLPGQTLTDESTQTKESIAPKSNSNTVSDIVTSSYFPLPSTSKCLIGPGTSFLIPRSQTTKSIAPAPKCNTTFGIVAPSYVPIPSTSRCVLGPGTSFLIPIGPDFPLNDSTETTEPNSY